MTTAELPPGEPEGWIDDADEYYQDESGFRSHKQFPGSVKMVKGVPKKSKTPSFGAKKFGQPSPTNSKTLWDTHVGHTQDGNKRTESNWKSVEEFKKEYEARFENGSNYADWAAKYDEAHAKNNPKTRNPDKKKGRNKTKFSNTGFYAESKPQREKIMANKFLPFIVESSTPKSIFKTLLSRSKGMNKILVASMFNLTLNVDIKKLRNIAKELQEMPLEQLYEEMLQKYDIYRVNSTVLAYFKNVVKYFPKERDSEGYWWTEELTEFDAENVMMFFCVHSIKEVGSSEYSDIDWSGLWNHQDTLMNFRNHITFSDEGREMYFKGLHDLQTFILYKAILEPQMDPKYTEEPICAKYK